MSDGATRHATPRTSTRLTPPETAAPRVALPRSRPARVAAVVALWLVALAVTIAMGPWIQRASFVFFWGAVLYAAWSLGTTAALVAALASVVAVHYWLMEPVGTLELPTPGELLTFGVFVVVAMTVSTLTRGLARAQARAAEYLAELTRYAEQLADQAAELELANDEAETLRAEAEQGNRVKSEFLATMSHELRTPLNAIGGYVQLLEMGIRGPLTPDQRDDLQRIRRNQQHLLALISDVLDVSRLESGRTTFEIGDVELGPLLAEAGVFIGPQVAARALHYEYVPPPPGLRARADGEKVRQVVLNLLSNAVKFTPEGGRIALSCEVQEDRVMVVVRDSGPGIPEAQREVIFAPFVQLGRSHSSIVEGTGLGLAISRRYARGMSGELDVESGESGGSTFRLTLPLARTA